MIKLILIYIALCVLASLISKDLNDVSKAKSFVFKFFCSIILTPLFGWIIVWFLNLPVDNSVNEEMLKKIKRRK